MNEQVEGLFNEIFEKVNDLEERVDTVEETVVNIIEEDDDKETK